MQHVTRLTRNWALAPALYYHNLLMRCYCVVIIYSCHWVVAVAAAAAAAAGCGYLWLQCVAGGNTVPPKTPQRMRLINRLRWN